MFYVRYILDGYPVTKRQVELLTERKIIPVRVVELQVEDDEVLRRGTADRHSPTRYQKWVLVRTCGYCGLCAESVLVCVIDCTRTEWQGSWSRTRLQCIVHAIDYFEFAFLIKYVFQVLKYCRKLNTLF